MAVMRVETSAPHEDTVEDGTEAEESGPIPIQKLEVGTLALFDRNSVFLLEM